MNRYVTEAVGTFFLVLTIGCTVVPGSGGVIAPLAIGVALAAIVYAGGPTSGAHYNPAVTVAIWLRGRFAAGDVVPYWIAQITGAALASVVVGYLRGLPSRAPAKPDIGPWLTAEFLFTFALVWVILSVATSKRTAGNAYYGLAIGFIVMAGAFAVGDITSGAFNPAVAVGLAMMGLAAWSSLWIYLVATLLAALAGAAVFRCLHPDDP